MNKKLNYSRLAIINSIVWLSLVIFTPKFKEFSIGDIVISVYTLVTILFTLIILLRYFANYNHYEPDESQ